MSEGIPQEGRREGPAFHAEGNIGGERRAVRRHSESRGRGEREHLDKSVPLAASIVPLGAGIMWGAIGAAFGGWSAPAALATVFGVWGLGYLLIQMIVRGSGRFATGLYNPSGASTAHKKEYSYEESLVARGLYEEAATAYELAAHENPGDATPVIRLARILRDHLERYEDAAKWFKRVPQAGAGAGEAFLARKELVELYWHKMNEPQKAAPDLARMAEELAGTPEGDWAAGELAAIKKIMAEQQGLG